MPKSSPAILVNLLIIAQALNIARRNRKSDVQTHPAKHEILTSEILLSRLKISSYITESWIKDYHPAQAKNNSFPRSSLPFAKYTSVHYNRWLGYAYNQERLSTNDGMYDTTDSSRSQSLHCGQASIYVIKKTSKNKYTLLQFWASIKRLTYLVE